MDKDEAKRDQFHCQIAATMGSARVHKHWTGLYYTDGIKYIADTAGAYWLIDAIALWQPHVRPMVTDFQVWELKTFETYGAELCVRDAGTITPIGLQRFEYTDFPTRNIKLILNHGILYHPAEVTPVVGGLNAIQRLFHPTRLARIRAEGIQFLCRNIQRMAAGKSGDDANCWF